jgi:hypothetical protein
MRSGTRRIRGLVFGWGREVGQTSISEGQSPRVPLPRPTANSKFFPYSQA